MYCPMQAKFTPRYFVLIRFSYQKKRKMILQYTFVFTATNPGYISADEGSGYASDGDLTKFPSSKPASSAIYLSPK